MSIIDDNIENTLYCTLVTARRTDTCPTEKVRKVMAEVLPRFREPWRYYHTIQHIVHCLGGLECWKEIPCSRSSAELAIWYHDLVYDPKRHDNEQVSAAILEEHAAFLDLDPWIVTEARGAILATTHKVAPISNTAKLVVDLDLDILRVPEPRFDEYERQVREEYGFIDDATWILGRSRVLQSFLDRDWIYSTPTYRKLFEGDARANLKRSIVRLAKGEVLRLVA